MKFYLDEEFRIKSFTRDILAQGADFECTDAELPAFEDDNELFEYKIVNGEFVHSPAEQEVLIHLEITSIVGVNEHSSKMDFATGHEQTNITIEGVAPGCPDRTFQLPARRDDGRLFFFDAVVTNGTFKCVLNFPTVGEFEYTDKEANHGLNEKTFTVQPTLFRIGRKEGSVLTDTPATQPVE